MPRSVPSRLDDFAARIVAWQRLHGRHTLPWQQARDPYRIWVSEIMLQQTQVGTALAYYQRFIERFPTVRSLAAASLDEVMAVWAGLGYYRRAHLLHRAAKIVMERFGGHLPEDVDMLESLPGVGRSTAGAIAALAWRKRVPILDGNVKRVLTRHAGQEGFPGRAAIERKLWALAWERLPKTSDDMPAYTQGLMDLGATVCTRDSPDCIVCPIAADCVARSTGRTQALPTPRPRRTLPERRQRFLLAMHAESWLLVKRPAVGVWAGLWCPPEIAEGESLEAAVRRLGIAACDALPAPEPLLHAFTHFRLHIEPVAVAVSRQAPTAAEVGTIWLPRAEVARAALPAPMRRLLSRA